jgi:hypothetical protein
LTHAGKFKAVDSDQPGREHKCIPPALNPLADQERHPRAAAHDPARGVGFLAEAVDALPTFLVPDQERPEALLDAVPHVAVEQHRRGHIYLDRAHRRHLPA